MATRSMIIIENKDGSAEGIYCHFDGYLDHHKPILLGHYETEEKVRELIALGNISMLAETIGEKQDFDDQSTQHDDWCLAYGRDRGEADQEAYNGATWKAVAKQIDCFPAYVFRVTDGQWYYCSDEKRKLVPLAKASD